MSKTSLRSTGSVSALATRTLASLTPGEMGYVVGCSDIDLGMRCQEIGLPQGSCVRLCRINTPGQWLYIETNEGCFSLRQSEAKHIHLADKPPKNKAYRMP